MKSIQKELQSSINDYLVNNPDKEVELAGVMLVSIPTIKRWREGKNLPQEIIAKAMVEYIKSLSSES